MWQLSSLPLTQRGLCFPKSLSLDQQCDCLDQWSKAGVL